MSVLRTLDADGIAVAGLALREPSLDDVFLSLTGHRAEEDNAAVDPGDTATAQSPQRTKGGIS